MRALTLPVELATILEVKLKIKVALVSYFLNLSTISSLKVSEIIKFFENFCFVAWEALNIDSKKSTREHICEIYQTKESWILDVFNILTSFVPYAIC